MEECLKCVERDSAEGVPGELELRVGRWDGGRFVPGVSREVFEQLERDLTESHLEGDGGWKEFVDYHYHTAAHGGRARSRIEFDSDRMERRKQHVCKEQRHSLVLQRLDNSEACRLAWSYEIPLVTPPAECMPTHVRIQQRRRFVDRREGKVVWMYELSKVWSANTRSGVEYMQHNSDPAFEVECEFVDEGGAYRGAHSFSHLQRSLQAKANMLLGDEPGTDLEVMGVRVAERKGGERRTKRCRR